MSKTETTAPAMFQLFVCDEPDTETGKAGLSTVEDFYTTGEALQSLVQYAVEENLDIVPTVDADGCIVYELRDADTIVATATIN